MNIKFNFIRLTCCLFLAAFSSLFAQNTKSWLKREFPHLVVENKLWIGTPNGLYQYHPEEDTWTIYGKHNGLPANEVNILLWDGELLWATTPAGVAAGDIKLNKWLIYTAQNGLPSNTIFSVAAREDYVWVGTDSGAARFDKLIQEWELFTTQDGLPGSVVYDIAIDGDRVYFATNCGLAEYDTNFEKWRYYSQKDGIASDTIQFIYQTTDYLWLFTSQGPSRFSKKLHTTLSFTQDHRLKYNAIRDLVVDEEQFWVGTTAGVLIYDPGNSIWRDFQEEINLPDRDVSALTFFKPNRWFLTRKGIAVYNSVEKSWRRYDETHGLSSGQYKAVAGFMGKVFLVNQNTIDYLHISENRWYKYPLKNLAERGVGKGSFFSLDKEKGSFLQIIPGVRLSLSGSRLTYRYKHNHKFQFDPQKSTSSGEGATRGDLKGQLSLTKERTINAFYNDTDYSEILYGVRYKGKKGDFVQEINWGDVRYEQGKNSLIPSLGIFGVSGRAEAGPKTERYKRSLITAKGWSGEKTSGFESEFFTGNFENGEVTIRDIDFRRNIFFRLDTTQTVFPVDEGSEIIFVDDGQGTTNDANTQLNAVINGEIGDFDRLQPFLDYRMDYSRGEIRFMKPLSVNAVVIVLARSRGVPFQRTIKKLDLNSYICVNRYFVGGMGIIPYSFELEILDHAGNRQALSDFGLDRNRDNRVDPEWIDYRQGILTFPEQKPFPAAVYSDTNPATQFQLHIEFLTEFTIFKLKHNHLIRGSEQVVVDGEILKEDYVLDYTSGTLLIIKEGAVAEDSEIEVNYEYYRNTREKFQLAGIGFGPSDNILMALNYFAFDPEGSGKSSAGVTGFNFFSELKWRFKNIDLKFTPEAASSQNYQQSGRSIHLRSDLSSDKFRLLSRYEKYDPGFQSPITRKFQLGNLYDRQLVQGTFYPVSFIDLSTNWSKQRTQLKANGRKDSQEDLGGKVLFSKNLFPALSISGRRRTLKAGDFHSTKETVKGELEYLLPAEMLRKMSVKSLRIYSIWRRSREDIERTDAPGILHNEENIFDTQYLRFDFSPMNLVQINSYYRGKTTGTRDAHQDQGSRLLNQRKKLFLDLTVDRIQGANMSLRFQSEIAEYFPGAGSNVHDIGLNRSLQTSIRFFPGRWFQPLAPFSFEISYQPLWQGHLRNLEQDLTFTEQFIRTLDFKALTAAEGNKLYQVRGEWRPTAAFLYYSGIDFYKITSQSLGSQLETNIQQFNQKIEYRPAMNSLLTVQYFRNRERKANFSTITRDNPMIWFERRWSERLQTKLNLTFWQERLESGKISESSSSLSPLIGVTYRFSRAKSGASTAEIRNDLSCAFYRNTRSYRFLAYNSYSNSFAIDYFPASVLILRFRLVSTYRDYLDTDLDLLDNMLEFRFTAQF